MPANVDSGVRLSYSPGMVTDTGRTVRQLRGGEWTDIPVLIRDGHYCLCGDLHGRFARCVGSAAAPDRPRKTSAPRERSRPGTFNQQVAQEYFPLPKRRLPKRVPQAAIDACDGCGPFHEAFYYCETHRSQAVRNVLLAGRKSGGIISLHLMMADKGYDIVS